MKALSLSAGACFGLILAGASFGADRLELRQKAWREALDRTPFHFKDDEATAKFSLKQVGENSSVRMVSYQSGKATFEFVREGKPVLTIEGSLQSVFRIEKNTLFFAHFTPTRTGCEVTAYDLDRGKELWSTKLEGLGKVGHEQYRNRVTMELSNGDGKDGGVVVITGKETNGDYVEVLDQKTGKQLAHKVYRRIN